MGEDKARKAREQAEEDLLKKRSEEINLKTIAAIDKASEPSAFQKGRMEQVLSFQDWLAGKKGPLDIRNMPGPAGALNFNLFTTAKAAHDAGRIGRGFGTMSGGANPNYVAKLESENQMGRDLAASGALEENVNQAVAQNTAEGYDLSGQYNAQNQFIANTQTGREGSASDRYLQWMQRPRPQSFGQQLLLEGVRGATGIAASYLTGGLNKAVSPAMTKAFYGGMPPAGPGR